MIKKQFITWTKAVSVGIAIIDNQHRELFRVINDVHNHEKNSDLSYLNATLTELIELTRVHFTTEENYFRRFKYPEATEHIVEHEKMILKVLQFKIRFDQEGAKILPDLLSFLREWWDTHLKIEDHKYAAYFKEKGYI